MELISILLNNRIIFEAIDTPCGLIIIKNERRSKSFSNEAISYTYHNKINDLIKYFKTELPNCKVFSKKVDLESISVFNLINRLEKYL